MIRTLRYTLIALGVVASVYVFAPREGSAAAQWGCWSAPPDTCCNCYVDWDPDTQQQQGVCYDTLLPRFTECDPDPQWCPTGEYDCRET